MNAPFLKQAKGAPFLALPANCAFVDADGESSLDAGAFVRTLKHSSGTSPMLVGKPSPKYFMARVRSAGCDPPDAIMIGDNAESDAAGAIEAGIDRGIPVRTEKYRGGDEEYHQRRPSAAASDVEEAVELVHTGDL